MKRFIILLLVTPLFFTGCIEDPCSTFICLNGGDTVEISDTECECDCPPEFTGVNCQDAVMANPCENVNCLNDGVCNDGTCDCPDGFMGDNCEDADPCFNVACVNGTLAIADGVCTCECTEGFGGEDCSEEISTDFIAEWDAVDACEIFMPTDSLGNTLPTFPYRATIFQNMMGDYVVQNFSAIDPNLGFTATLDNNTITIPLSEAMTDYGTYLVEGTGTLSDDGNTLNWTYTTELDGQLDNCTGVWTRVQ